MIEHETPVPPPAGNARRGIITIAHGKPRYLNMAKHLGWSLQHHAPELPRVVVSDADPAFFGDSFDQVIPHLPEYGRNVEQKLHLDLYSPFEETLFIDADSLVCKPLEWIFDSYQDLSFTSPGYEFILPGQSDDQWRADFDKIFTHFEISQLPKFNGGVYFFRKDATAEKVFKTARELWEQHDVFGIEEFRGAGPPDELLFSISMELHKTPTRPDDGLIMRTLFGLEGSLTLDTLNGGSHFVKSGNTVEPAVVHFASFGAYHPVYVRECHQLTYAHNPSASVRARHLLRPIFASFYWARWWGIQILRRLRAR